MLNKIKKVKKKKSAELDCKECCRLIPDFIQENMKWEDARSFLHHLHSCENCKEEMELIYLIQVGLDMESEVFYNLKEDMNNLISDYQDEIQYNQRLLLLKRIIECAGEAMAWLMVIYWFIV